MLANGTVVEYLASECKALGNTIDVFLLHESMASVSLVNVRTGDATLTTHVDIHDEARACNPWLASSQLGNMLSQIQAILATQFFSFVKGETTDEKGLLDILRMLA